jgi:hypothetical protein
VTSSPGDRRRYGKAVLLGALAIGLALGVRASLGRIDSLDGEVPSRAETIAAMGFLLVGQLVLGYGWRRLVPQISDPVASMWAFHASQPGKYLPIGIGQAAGQVALARDLSVPVRTAVAAWGAQTLTIVAAGITVGSLLVFQRELEHLRWLGLLGPLGLLAAWRPALAAVVGFGARFTRRLPDADDLPSQRRLLDAFGTALVFFVFQGIAFAILLGTADDPAAWLALVGASAMAAGLSTATPLPAGLGVREALLVLFCPGDAGLVIAAAVVLRVSSFAVEVAVLAAFGLVLTARRRRAGVPSSAPEPPASAGPPPAG